MATHAVNLISVAILYVHVEDMNWLLHISKWEDIKLNIFNVRDLVNIASRGNCASLVKIHNTHASIHLMLVSLSLYVHCRLWARSRRCGHVIDSSHCWCLVP